MRLVSGAVSDPDRGGPVTGVGGRQRYGLSQNNLNESAVMQLRASCLLGISYLALAHFFFLQRAKCCL